MSLHFLRWLLSIFFQNVFSSNWNYEETNKAEWDPLHTLYRHTQTCRQDGNLQILYAQTHAGMHPDIRSCGFISVASAPDTSTPIGWLGACIHNEGLKWDVSEESDASCFVFLASGGRGCASCCASENDIPHCESAQQSRAGLTKQGTLSISLWNIYLSDANCRRRRCGGL